MGFDTARFKIAHRHLISIGLLWAAGLLIGCMPTLPDEGRLTIICPAECDITFANPAQGPPPDPLQIGRASCRERVCHRV